MNTLVELKSLRYLVLVLCAILLWILWSRNTQLSPPGRLADVLAGDCAQDCMESPQLIQHIQTVLAKPSGTKPVLKNPEELENQKGQSGQVEAIMEHFNHKVRKYKTPFKCEIIYLRHVFRKMDSLLRLGPGMGSS